MSLIPAVKKQIAQRKEKDPVRLTLEFLLWNGIGHTNAVRLRDVEIHLRENGVVLPVKSIQQKILAESRKSDWFIGTCHRGCFLIDTNADYEAMNSFYATRIAQEQANQNKLIGLKLAASTTAPKLLARFTTSSQVNLTQSSPVNNKHSNTTKHGNTKRNPNQSSPPDAVSRQSN